MHANVEPLRRTQIAAALQRSSKALFSGSRHPEGFWCGELTADTTLESDYILLQLCLHQPEDHAWNPPTSRAHRAGRALHPGAADARWRLQYLRRRALRSQRHGEGLLRAETGRHPRRRAIPLRWARARILALGGLQAANSYVKINLSLFGLYPARARALDAAGDRDAAGNVLYEMSSWTRSILVPLSIVQARGSNRRAPAGFTLDELLLPGASLALPKR